MNRFINEAWRNRLILLGLLIIWTRNIVYSIANDIFRVNYDVFDILLSLIGLGLTLCGCYIWTRLKNRHWAFMFWGILTPIGLLGVSLLKDKSV